MRARNALPVALLLVAGCKSEPSFDERYAAQSAKMNATVGAIESDLNMQLNASQAAKVSPGTSSAKPTAHGTAVP